MNREDFNVWMDKQIAFYREGGIPFLGYFWTDRNLSGGALYRLDKPMLEKQVTKTTIREIMSTTRKLKKEGKQVFIYQG